MDKCLDIKKVINKILIENNINIEYNVILTNDMYNILYVNKNNNKYIFYANIEEIENRQFDLEVILYHEIYHIKQYLNNFPMIVSDNQKFSIIQKIITDLYVSIDLIDDEKYEKAYILFKYRSHKIQEKSFDRKNIEDNFRLAYMLFESKYIFKEDEEKINNKILNMNEESKEKINKIFYVLKENYEKKDIISMYYELIKLMDKNQSFMMFQNNIII